MSKYGWLAIALCLSSISCGEMSKDSSLAAPRNSSSDENSKGEGVAQCYGANDCQPGYYCNELGTCALLKTADGSTTHIDGGVLAPEVENRREMPASGKQFVYVAIPKQNMVAKIDSQSLQVRAIKVGNNPGALQTILGQDVALLLNRSSATATLLRSKSDGGDEMTTFPTVPGVNRLVVSPDGKSAVAFFDLRQGEGQFPPKETLQDVTLLKLDPLGREQSIHITTGFKPVDVQFTKNSSHAFVITETGLSIIEIAKTSKPLVAPWVSLLKDPFKENKPDEVLITPDGKLAILRQTGTKGIRVVDLASAAIKDIALGSDATDLKMTDDGALLLAILRDTGEMVFMDLPMDLDDPSGIEKLTVKGYTIGQVSLANDGKRAFLFSNATPQKVALIVDLVERQLTAFPLKKGVRAVYSNPDGTRAIIMHNKVPGTAVASEGEEVFFDKSYGYSLLNVSTGFVKLVLTETEPDKLTFPPQGLAAYLLLSDPAKQIRSVECIDLNAFSVESITVGSPPIGLGILLSTGKIYVAQSHPLGRITFIDQSTLKGKTVTGFELNSYIIE